MEDKKVNNEELKQSIADKQEAIKSNKIVLKDGHRDTEVRK